MLPSSASLNPSQNSRRASRGAGMALMGRASSRALASVQCSCSRALRASSHCSCQLSRSPGQRSKTACVPRPLFSRARPRRRWRIAPPGRLNRLQQGGIRVERCHEQPPPLPGGAVGLLVDRLQQQLLSTSPLQGVSLPQRVPPPGLLLRLLFAAQTGCRRSALSQPPQGPGQLLSLLGRRLIRLTGPTDACSGAGPAPAPAGQVQSS